MNIAAQQIQDSCNRVRETAKPYAYLNRDAEDARRVGKLELSAARPIIVPKRYGGGVTKDDFGYTGLGVVNDGEQPGHDLTIHNIQLKDGTKLVFYRGHTERLTETDGEVFYPAFLEMRLGGTFGSGLFDFMRERGIPSITVPITYRDSSNNWFHGCDVRARRSKIWRSQARLEAEADSNSLFRERLISCLADFLVVRGLLHACGYDK